MTDNLQKSVLNGVLRVVLISKNAQSGLLGPRVVSLVKRGKPSAVLIAFQHGKKKCQHASNSPQDKQK